MDWRWSALTLILFASPAAAGEPVPVGTEPGIPLLGPDDAVAFPASVQAGGSPAGAGRGFLSGNHNFPNFINFISNPIQSIDPRAVTAIYPIFGSAWVSNASPIPDGDFQLYGPALTLALSERFAVGLNQGGLADAHFSRNPAQRQRILQDEVLQGRLSDRVRNRIDTTDFSGDRFGFLNPGGFFQYTLVQDVEDQFLLTGGIRWEAPAGSHEVFQGHGPAHLAPYLTAGKEYGEFHVLVTTGFQFPAGPGNDNSKIFYANVHFDRRLFGWLYPLVEFNSIYHTTSLSSDFGLNTRRGFVDFDNFESSGNLVSLAAGANAVLVPERLEIGAVYTTTIATQRDFHADGLIVKMTLRF
jgi:hypothetical protein